jgi:acetolactate synthase regulatory subunit
LALWLGRSDQKEHRMIRAPSQSNAGATELTLMVEFADDADDALLRVFSTLHRRRCRVTAVEFAADRRASGRLALRIQAPTAHAGRVAHWLNSLVDVRHVRTTPIAVAPSGAMAETGDGR